MVSDERWLTARALHLPTGVVIDTLAGCCPVQGEGSLFVYHSAVGVPDPSVCDHRLPGDWIGLPWYFRARGKHWSFHLAARKDDDPVAVGPGGHEGGAGFYYRERWTEERHAAGYMESAEAIRCLHVAIVLFRHIGFNMHYGQ